MGWTDPHREATVQDAGMSPTTDGGSRVSVTVDVQHHHLGDAGDGKIYHYNTFYGVYLAPA